MEEHISDRLHSCCHIINSDDDLPSVLEIVVGIDSRGQLAVCIDLYDYEDPEEDCSTVAVVNFEDTRQMARRHRIEHQDLPKFIGGQMMEWGDVVNPTFTQVRACFKEIVDSLIEEGCRLKIERIDGEGGCI